MSKLFSALHFSSYFVKVGLIWVNQHNEIKLWGSINSRRVIFHAWPTYKLEMAKLTPPPKKNPGCRLKIPLDGTFNKVIGLIDHTQCSARRAATDGAIATG